MKRALALLTMFFVIPLNAGTLPLVNLPCGADQTVYINALGASVNVDLQVTAGCSGATLKLFRKGATKESQKYDLKTGQTGAVSLTVEPGGSIQVKCAGKGAGSCSYALALH